MEGGGGYFTLFDITVPLYKTQDQKMEEVGGCFTLFDLTLQSPSTRAPVKRWRARGAVML